MQLLAVNLNVSMAWGVTLDDPKTLPLECMRGWSLLNPFLYEPVRRLQPDPESVPGATPTYISGGFFHCNTNGFVLVSSASRNIAWNDQLLQQWQDKLMSLIRHFRNASKQFTLLPEIDSIKPFELTQLPVVILPLKGELTRAPTWEIATAVTTETVTKVSQGNLAQSPPTYDTLLLDAMESVVKQNYRNATLLSAAAIESLARLKLEKVVEKTPKTLEPNEIQTAKITRLLSELSQNLLGRSISQDDPQLYESILILFKRRSELAPTGSLHEKLDYTAIWAAMDALRCAIQIVEWFGEPAGYVSPLDCNGSLLCNTSSHG